MRCTYPPCQSANTRLVKRTLDLRVSENGRILSYDIHDYYLCNDCGNPFFPAVRPVRFEFRGKRKPFSRKPRRVLKGKLFKELLEGLHFEIRKGGVE